MFCFSDGICGATKALAFAIPPGRRRLSTLLSLKSRPRAYNSPICKPQKPINSPTPGLPWLTTGAKQIKGPGGNKYRELAPCSGCIWHSGPDPCLPAVFDPEQHSTYFFHAATKFVPKGERHRLLFSPNRAVGSGKSPLFPAYRFFLLSALCIKGRGSAAGTDSPPDIPEQCPASDRGFLSPGIPGP